MAKKQFEEIFLRHAKIGFDAATVLHSLAPLMELNTGFIERLTLLEKDADRCAAEAFELMDNSFIPRYDKPDIAHLISGMDDFVDGVYKVAILFKDYDIKSIEKEAAGIMVILPQLATIVIRSMEQMPKLSLKDSLSALEQIKTLERQADRLRSEGRSRARKEFAALDFTIWNEIYRKLEHTADNYLYVMRIIVSMVRKESH